MQKIGSGYSGFSMLGKMIMIDATVTHFMFHIDDAWVKVVWLPFSSSFPSEQGYCWTWNQYAMHA